MFSLYARGLILILLLDVSTDVLPLFRRGIRFNWIVSPLLLFGDLLKDWLNGCS